MRLEPVAGIPKLATTPLPVVTVESRRVLIDLDDEDDTRLRLVFEPYQAVRMVTADCYMPPGDLSIIPKTVVEVIDSTWLEELRANLREIDLGASFMTKAHHYLIPLQDDFLEIAAWSIRLESAERS